MAGVPGFARYFPRRTSNPITAALVALTDAGVRFVVCGGVACILQGVARATHDLDLRVALERADLAGRIEVAGKLGLRSRIAEPPEALLDPERRRVWVEERHAVVYTFQTPSGEFAIDVFLVYPPGYDELAAAADRIEVERRVILVQLLALGRKSRASREPPPRVAPDQR